MLLFASTIAMAVIGHNTFHMPPVFGMLGGLAMLKIFGYFLKINSTEDSPFDVLHHVQRLEGILYSSLEASSWQSEALASSATWSSCHKQATKPGDRFRLSKRLPSPTLAWVCFQPSSTTSLDVSLS